MTRGESAVAGGTTRTPTTPTEQDPDRGERMSEQMERPTCRHDVPLGTWVRYWPGAREGEGRLGRVRTPVYVIGGQEVVSVSGYAGGIALTHMQPIHERDAVDAATGGRER